MNRNDQSLTRTPNLDQNLVGLSPTMQAVRRAIREYGPAQAPVLVTGESGTGKELAAQGLHLASPRAHRALVTVNCAALASTLFESELFGNVRGAFTGADRERDGLVGEAEGGTLFLDEIAELPLETQPKLLRLLEDHLYRPVGSGRERRADIRVIAATNRCLREQVDRGAFRLDLYYRINVLSIHMPALRDRAEDISHIVLELMNRAGDSRLVGEKAMDQLRAWPWPGNVRELVHVVRRTLIRSPMGALKSFDLEGSDSPARSNDAKRSSATSRVEFREAEREELLRHLNAQGWNVSAAARALGWTRGAMRSKMRTLGLQS